VTHDPVPSLSDGAGVISRLMELDRQMEITPTVEMVFSVD